VIGEVQDEVKGEELFTSTSIVEEDEEEGDVLSARREKTASLEPRSVQRNV